MPYGIPSGDRSVDLTHMKVNGIPTRQGLIARQGGLATNSLPLDTPLLLPLPRCQVTRHEVQPDSSTAKDWVKNPGGATRRKDRMGISSACSP